MKNLKRVLSMALATAMVLGMMVVGSSAAGKASEYGEAIAQIKVLGIMEGDENGNFNPDKYVTRNEMAVVMSNLADLKLNGSHPFNDVPTWADKYVGALYTNGLTSGVTATTFGGSDNITTASAALMIMKTMGYFSYQGEFGNDWLLATVKQATKIDLFEDIDAGVKEPLTRGELAQMISNALEQDTVIVTETAGLKVEGEGITVTQTATYEYTTDEQLFDKLFDADKYDVEENGTDSFGRPAIEYTYDEESETVVEDALAVYAGAEFDEDTLDDDFEDWDVDGIKIVYNGGKDASVDMDALEESRKGYSIEVYGDKDEEIIEKIVVVEYTAAIVNEIETDDDDEVTEVTITVLNPAQGEVELTIDVEDDEDAYELIAELEDDDVFGIALAPAWDDEDADMDDVILAVDEVESVEGEVTSSKLSSGYNGWIKVDGSKYDMAWIYSGAAVDTEYEGTFYLYNDYVIHFDGETADEDEEYAFVLRAGKDADKWGEETYFAEVVFADGTTAEIELANKDSYNLVKDGNEVVEFKYDDEDEVYKLIDTITDKGAATINKGKTAIKDGETKVATATGKTEFVIIELDDGDIDDVKVYTGYKTVASVEVTSLWVVDDYMFAIYGDAVATDSDDVIYVAKESKSGVIKDKDLGEYRTVNAVVDGEIVEIMIEKDVNIDAVLFDSSKINDDEVYTALSGSVEIDTYVGDFKKAADDVITIEAGEDEHTLAYTDDVAVFVIDEDGEITEGSIKRNYSDVTVKVIVNDDDEATTIFIEK